METPAEHAARKQAELDLLAGLVGERAPLVVDARARVELKQQLRARIVAAAIVAEPSLAESRWDRDSAPRFVGGRLSWFYQRHDLRLVRPRFASLVYPALVGEHLSLGWLAGSGMGVLTSTYLGLDRSLAAIAAGSPHPPNRGDPRSWILPVDAYFETHQLASRLSLYLRPDWDAARAPLDGVLHIDSIARRPPLEAVDGRALDGLAAVVCDTTCWPRESPHIQEVVDRVVRDARVPLLLVRSHLKLDLLGTEHARLGSTVMLLPRAPVRREQVALARAVRRRALDWIAIAGATFAPHALWPAAFDPLESSTVATEFARLNARRNALLADNNREAARRLVDSLEGSLTQVQGYHHGCFLVVMPLLEGEAVCRRYADELTLRLVAAGLDARIAPSFGYDFIAVTRVGGSAGGQSVSAVRVALPDFDAESLERFVATTTEWAAPLGPE